MKPNLSLQQTEAQTSFDSADRVLNKDRRPDIPLMLIVARLSVAPVSSGRIEIKELRRITAVSD
jgi:hypothetical protein